MGASGFEGLTEQLDHLFRPILLMVPGLKSQVAQQVRVAEGVGTLELCTAFEAVMYKDVPEAWQYAKFFEGDRAALGMHGEPAQGFAGEYMQPVQPPTRAPVSSAPATGWRNKASAMAR